MPDLEEFIERQVSFQVGTCAASPDLDLETLALREATRRPSLVLHDVRDGSFSPPDRGFGIVRTGDAWAARFNDTPVPLGKKIKAGRKANVLTDLYDLGLRAPVILDMNDAVNNQNPFPTFQYNRQRSAVNSILWPLQRVHKIGSKDFVSLPNPSESRLKEKEPRLFWRGSVRGFSTHGNKARSITGLVKNYTAGMLKRTELLSHLATVPRYVFVSRHFDRTEFDIGFYQKDKAYMMALPEIGRFERPHTSPSEQFTCRYLLAISGTDVASSFGWQIATNCVVLRESYPWEVFFDCHFRPWEHYVPIKSDFTDVIEKMNWCENHLDECQRMIDRRHMLIPLLLDEAARREALRRVVQRYNAFWCDWRRTSALFAG